MSNKREQRLRRKARAHVRAAERQAAELAKLKPIALAAIRYVNEIDSPNPAEPYAIANRRDELRDVVHAVQGRPQRGVRREPQAVRAVAPIVPLRAVGSLPSPSPKKETRMSNDQLARDVEVKRRALRDAAAKYGAEANKRNRNSVRVAELGAALEAAAKAFVVAEAARRVDEMRAEREAGAAS